METSEEIKYRKEALKTLKSPEQIHEYVRVTHPALYITISAMVICCIVVVMWIIKGTISYSITIDAIVFPHKMVTAINAEKDGVIEKVLVERGDFVYEGSPLFIANNGRRSDTIFSKTEGSVLMFKNTLEPYDKYATLMYLIESNSQVANNELIAFVSYEDLAKIKVGQTVEVTPSNLSREDDGYILGKITGIDKYPTKPGEAMGEPEMSQFVEKIFPKDDMLAYRVLISLDTDENDNLAWSRSSSSYFVLENCSFCDVKITTQRSKVYEVFLNKTHGMMSE